MYVRTCLNVALSALLASFALNWCKKVNFLGTDKNVKKKKDDKKTPTTTQNQTKNPTTENQPPYLIWWGKRVKIVK